MTVETRFVEIDQIGYTTRQAAITLGLNYSTFRSLVAKVRRKSVLGVDHERYDAMPPETLDVYRQIVQLNKSGFTWDSAINRVQNKILEGM